MSDILAGRRRSTLGVVGNALAWATSGVSRPQEGPLPLPPVVVGSLEALLAPLFRLGLIGFAYWSRACIWWHKR